MAAGEGGGFVPPPSPSPPPRLLCSSSGGPLASVCAEAAARHGCTAGAAHPVASGLGTAAMVGGSGSPPLTSDGASSPGLVAPQTLPSVRAGDATGRLSALSPLTVSHVFSPFLTPHVASSSQPSILHPQPTHASATGHVSSPSTLSVDPSNTIPDGTVGLNDPLFSLPCALPPPSGAPLIAGCPLHAHASSPAPSITAPTRPQTAEPADGALPVVSGSLAHPPALPSASFSSHDGLPLHSLSGLSPIPVCHVFSHVCTPPLQTSAQPSVAHPLPAQSHISGHVPPLSTVAPALTRPCLDGTAPLNGALFSAHPLRGPSSSAPPTCPGGSPAPTVPPTTATPAGELRAPSSDAAVVPSSLKGCPPVGGPSAPSTSSGQGRRPPSVAVPPSTGATGQPQALGLPPASQPLRGGRPRADGGSSWPCDGTPVTSDTLFLAESCGLGSSAPSSCPAGSLDATAKAPTTASLGATHGKAVDQRPSAAQHPHLDPMVLAHTGLLTTPPSGHARPCAT